MPTLTAQQIANHANAAGFRGRALAVAVAVALAESSGRTDATNRNSNGSTDHGLWQINSVHADKLRSGTWSNPADNARMAYAVYREAGNSFSPWVAYTTGRYLVHMPAASRAAQSPSTPSAPGSVTVQPVNTVTDSLAGLVKLGALLTDPGTWARVGYFLAGMALIVYALMKLTGDNKLSETAKGAIMLAATRKPRVKAA